MTTTTLSGGQFSVEDTEVAFASRSNTDLMKMDWMFSIMNNPGLNKLSTNLLLTAIKLHLPIKSIVKSTVFRHFCGGETLEECMKTMDGLAKYGIGSILDYSVEGEKNESGFDHVVVETIDTIKIAAQNKHVPFAVFKTSGICSVDLLEKAQFGKLVEPADKEAFGRSRKRFSAICEAAGKFGVRLFVDAEESWIQDTIDAWTYEEMALYNMQKAIIFNTFQLYRADMLRKLKMAGDLAKNQRFVLGAKLVRGAYMEKEAAYASKNNTTNPIQLNKEATDTDFDLAWAYCLENLESIHFCAGSHNEKSNMELARQIQLLHLQKDDARIWFAQLYGMSDNISYALAKAGFNVAKYVPYGPVLSVMPYLVRRATENTSVAGQTSRELALIKKEIKRRKTANR